jgi:hypothetical protein
MRLLGYVLFDAAIEPDVRSVSSRARRNVGMGKLCRSRETGTAERYACGEELVKCSWSATNTRFLRAGIAREGIP